MKRISIALFRRVRIAGLMLGAAGLLASAGCDRSQPGPKPISGNEPAVGAAPTGPAPNTPARKD